MSSIIAAAYNSETSTRRQFECKALYGRLAMLLPTTAHRRNGERADLPSGAYSRCIEKVQVHEDQNCLISRLQGAPQLSCSDQH